MARMRLRGAGAAATIAAATASLLISGTATANVLPPPVLVFNVQPYDPDFCATTSISQCSDCVQWTEATGEIEFDMFLDDPYWYVGEVERIVLDVHYPDAWYSYCAWWPGFELCSGPGNAWCETIGEGAIRITIEYSEPFHVNGFALIGRFFFWVESYGALEMSASIDGDNFVWVSHAEAGVECSYGFMTCEHDYRDACRYMLDPETLELMAPQGGTDSGVVQAASWQACSVEFTDDADWMSLDIHWVDQHHAEVEVTAAAGDLPVGVYEARLRAESEARDCTRVIFHVEEPTAVRFMTWGSLRALYR